MSTMFHKMIGYKDEKHQIEKRFENQTNVLELKAIESH